MRTVRILTKAYIRITVAAILMASLIALSLLEFGSTPIRSAICRSIYPEYASKTVYTTDLAPSINASSLMAHFLAIREGRAVSSSIVPGEIIHQSWKAQDVPPVYHSLVTSWRSAYSKWTYVLWDNGDNRALVETFYPEWLKAYEALPSDIYRAHFTRSLYTFGGIYADIDSEAVSPLDTLVKAQRFTGAPTAFLGTMETSSHKLHGIPNAFMAASAPGHPLWLIAAQDAVDWARARSWDHSVPAPGPEYISGSVSLRRSIINYSPSVLRSPVGAENNAFHPTSNEAIAPVVLFSPEVIYPFAWDRPRPHVLTAAQECVCWMALSTFNPERCKQMTGARWVVHYWKRNWKL
ncbi:Glycosyltransferase sugar-binding region containing DXD motif [Rhizoctonia solani]|uniref:Glycosyltransferase sugar-binding region containing DXD motif n=1 Tax=Rhizoctonia solani TaxID=456999 RepID=A0A8H7M194_9AGAM|nr:Glycosyltransferase sugar-binding region containing DXD motif [Rhizoctonia solani]